MRQRSLDTFITESLETLANSLAKVGRSDGASTKWEVEKKGLPHGVAATAALLDKTLTVLAKIPFAGTLVPSVSLPVDLSSKPKFSLKQSFSL